jgi:hypothetical protein
MTPLPRLNLTSRTVVAFPNLTLNLLLTGGYQTDYSQLAGRLKCLLTAAEIRPKASLKYTRDYFTSNVTITDHVDLKFKYASPRLYSSVLFRGTRSIGWGGLWWLNDRWSLLSGADISLAPFPNLSSHFVGFARKLPIGYAGIRANVLQRQVLFKVKYDRPQRFVASAGAGWDFKAGNGHLKLSLELHPDVPIPALGEVNDLLYAEQARPLRF